MRKISLNITTRSGRTYVGEADNPEFLTVSKELAIARIIDGVAKMFVNGGALTIDSQPGVTAVNCKEIESFRVEVIDE